VQFDSLVLFRCFILFVIMSTQHELLEDVPRLSLRFFRSLDPFRSLNQRAELLRSLNHRADLFRSLNLGGQM